jgi:hypothetical protein
MQEPPKFTQITIFGLNHLATLVSAKRGRSTCEQRQKKILRKNKKIIKSVEGLISALQRGAHQNQASGFL